MQIYFPNFKPEKFNLKKSDFELLVVLKKKIDADIYFDCDVGNCCYLLEYKIAYTD